MEVTFTTDAGSCRHWGRTVSDTNPGFQPFGYAGGLTDPATGLIRYGARDYDPAITQWLSRDQIGFTGGTNHYAYADGDPVNTIDPTGHNATGCFADIFGLLGMIPVVGTVFDIAPALLYAANGDWGSAALALAGIIIPIAASELKGIARYGDEALELADEAAEAAEAGSDVVLNSPEVASRNLLNQVEEDFAVTPGGRSVRAHAADHIANGAPGRAPTTLSRVDDILDNPTSIRYDPLRDTVRVSQGKDFVVVSGTTPLIF